MKKLILATFIAILGAQAADKTCQSPVLKGIVEGANKNTPMRVDHLTSLLRLECKDASLKYVYELNSAREIDFTKMNDAKKQMFRDIQESILKNIYCTTFSQMHEYTNSVVWTYVFEGKKFVEVELKPSDCEK